MDYIKLNDDRFEHLNIVYRVIEYNEKPNSNGVSLVVENTSTNEIEHMVVASHYIEWLEAKDW